MSAMFRGRAVFKPLNTGRIDERVACVREWVANIFFLYTPCEERIRAENRLSQALAKVRGVLDFICYWLFNVCAIATMIRGPILSIGKLFG